MGQPRPADFGILLILASGPVEKGKCRVVLTGLVRPEHLVNGLVVPLLIFVSQTRSQSPSKIVAVQTDVRCLRTSAGQE